MTENNGVPKNWAKVTIRELATQINPGFPSGKHNRAEVGVPHLRPMNISPLGNIELSVVKYVQATDYDALKEGDVLFNNTNSPKLLGKTTYISRDTDWAYSNHMTRIRVNQDLVSSAWLANYLQFLFFTGFFRMNCTHHVNQASINTTFLSTNVEVPLPPRPEQERIVAKIEELFTQLEAGVAELQQAKVQLQRYRQAVLKSAVEGELTRDWRAAHQSELEPAEKLQARILSERRAKWEAGQWEKEIVRAQKKAAQAKRKAAGRPHNIRALKPEDWRNIIEDDYGLYLPKNDKWKEKYVEPTLNGTDDLPELPSSWIWVSLSAITSFIADVDHKMPKAQDDGIPYVSTRDFFGENDIDFENAKKISESDYQKLCRKIKPEFGDILLSRYGTVGEVRIVRTTREFQASYSIAIFKMLCSDEITEFAAVALRSEILQSQIRRDTRATAQPDLGLGHIRDFVMPFPPLAEQEAIIAKVERRMSVADEIEKELDQALARSVRLRQSILKSAFEGRLV